MGLRADRGAEGPGRGPARGRTGDPSTRCPAPRCTTSTTDTPSVTFTDAAGVDRRLVADVVVGCDGSFGPSRAAVPEALRSTWEKVYPYSWLGILADVAPSTDELIYAWHPDGFALHSMRSATVSRLYLQVPNGTAVEDWSDDRIWDALATRLGHGQDGWRLTPGPVTEKSVLPMRSFVSDPHAARPPLPGRRRRPHRAPHRRQGPQPGGRRRRAARPGPGRAAAQGRRPRGRRPTPTTRCAGSGAARTSPGG